MSQQDRGTQHDQGQSSQHFGDLAEPIADGLADEHADADVTGWRPDRRFDVWHDRALFHFLTEPEQRDGYRAALRRATAPGSWLIVATFAADGPERCSGLPVRRYDGPGLVAEFAEEFVPHNVWRDAHRSHGGVVQSFTWAMMRRR